MLFSIGNVVTLAIVIAMFVAYHLFTADNRSLEKLKRMGDKLKADLGSYVESRADEIKHYGIDLDVQQKAAKVVLEKIQEAQANIDEKSDSITAIADRFKDYDSILAKLMDMTQRVDQNIAHLSEKNEFIETLARRVESAGKKIDGIESEIPKIKEQFASDAKEILDSFRDEILDQLRDRLNDIVNMFERSRAEAQSAIDRATLLKEQIDAATSAALEAASERAHSIEDAAFETLRAHIASGFESLSRHAEERMEALAQKIESQSKTSDAALKAISASTAAQVVDNQQRLSEAKSALGSMTSDLARIQKETAEAIHALMEKFKSERAALESQFTQFGQAFEAHRASFEKEFLTEIKSLQDSLEHAKTQSEEIKNIANGNLSQALGTFEKDITDNLEQRKTAIDKHIDGWLSAMDSKIRKISQDALEQRKAEEARLAQEVNAELKRIRDGLYTQAQKIERDIEAFKNV